MASLLALLMLVAACGRAEPSPAPDAVDGYTSAYRGLCRSRAVVEENLGRARDIFFGESHSELHRLADETTEHDRALAGELLEAKNRTEAELGGGSPADAAASLDVLLRVSRQALISLGAPPQACDP